MGKNTEKKIYKKMCDRQEKREEGGGRRNTRKKIYIFPLDTNLTAHKRQLN